MISTIYMFFWIPLKTVLWKKNLVVIDEGEDTDNEEIYLCLLSTSTLDTLYNLIPVTNL